MDVLLEGGATLQERDYTLIIDKSQSMSATDTASGKSRWEVMQESAIAMATVCEQFDPDGITIYLFADEFKRYENITANKVAQIFQDNQPSGKTNLSAVLKDATDNYFSRRATERSKANGELIVIVTGGEVNNPQAVKQIMIDASNQLQRDEELAISLIQVGSNTEATELFQVLDHELQGAGAKFDICNAITLKGMERISLTDVLLKAIVD